MDLQTEWLVAAIPLLPLGGAIFNGLLGHRLPKLVVTVVALGTVLASALASAAIFFVLGDNAAARVSTRLYSWFAAGDLNVDIGLTVDHLSIVMALVITGVGFLIHLYSVGYMAQDPGYARYFAYLNLFTFAMLVLVLGDSLPVMFLGWEGVGLCSYLLIGFWYGDRDKAAAGKKAFIVNRIGDFGFLVAMMLLFRNLGTLSFSRLAQLSAAGAVGPVLATAVGLLLLLGATGKSAQLPLYVWLPDAMAGPTPVSALIHAATMVTAGVYMAARLSFLYTLAPLAMFAMALVGAVTAVFAATIGLAQNDIKKVLAYSTISQLGYMFLAAGVGAYAIAIFHLVTHAFFKACLFLGSGSVIHGMAGEQDMRKMGGLWRKQPITFVTFVAATLAIAGCPLTAGFISKDAILWSVYSSSAGNFGAVFAGAAKVLWLVGLATAGLTAFYMWRLTFLTFFSGPTRASHDVAQHVHESPWTMTVPLVVLAGLSLCGGVLGWPELLGGTERIARYLWLVGGSGGGAASEHTWLQLTLMSAATAIALAGFLLAYMLYGRRIHPAVETTVSRPPWRWVYQRVLGKWHVDELYSTTVVRPTLWTSRVVLYEGLDRRVIDGSVNLVAWITRSVGFLGQLLQNGNVQRYLAIFAIGLAVLLYGWFSP